MKNTVEIPAADMLSILFANRNQAYGAYQLRRQYPKTLGQALGYGIGLIMLSFAIPYISSKVSGAIHKDTKQVDAATVLTLSREIDLNIPKPPTTPPKQASPTRATQKFVPPVVKEDDAVTREDPPIVDELFRSVDDIGKANKEGNKNAPPVMNEHPIDIAIEKQAPPAEEKTYEPFDVQKPPSFPGGEAELLKYLSQHIKYPPLARESNIQGIVALTFVVGKDGEVRDVVVVKDIGGGCGKEAARVVESMPKWIPGEANGNPVKVRFTLPVRFRLE